MAFHRLDMTVSLESRVDELDGTGEIHSDRAIYTNKSWTIITHTTCLHDCKWLSGWLSISVLESVCLGSLLLGDD